MITAAANSCPVRNSPLHTRIHSINPYLDLPDACHPIGKNCSTNKGATPMIQVSMWSGEGLTSRGLIALIG
jgi:hypothetical protein